VEKNLQNKEALDKLKKLAEDIKFCMFATTDVGNNLYGRPMTTIQVDETGNIWFFTSDQTHVANEVSGGDKVCLNYAHPGTHSYLTVQGTGTMVKDRQKMEELWTDFLKAYFPDGLNQPDLVLLKVTPEQAHYWDGDASRVVQLFSYLKAKATGETADLGDEGELTLNK
jgi:general stress protein 26